MGVAYNWFSDLGFPGSVRRAIVRRYGNKGVNETRGCERDSPKLDAACVSGEGRNTKPNPLVGVAGDSSSEPVCESL